MTINMDFESKNSLTWMALLRIVDKVTNARNNEHF